MVSKEGEGDAGKEKARLQEAWVLTRGLTAPARPGGTESAEQPYTGPPRLWAALAGSPQLSPQCLFPS